MEAFEQLRQAGWPALVQYISTNEDEEDRDPSACWNGAKWLRFSLGDSLDVDDPTMEEITDLLTLEDGIYHFFCENNSYIHYFTLFLEYGKFGLLNTWGGEVGLFFSKYSRKNGLLMLQRALKGDEASFRAVFGLPKTTKLITLSSCSSLCYSRSSTS